MCCVCVDYFYYFFIFCRVSRGKSKKKKTVRLKGNVREADSGHPAVCYYRYYVLLPLILCVITVVITAVLAITAVITTAFRVPVTPPLQLFLPSRLCSSIFPLPIKSDRATFLASVHSPRSQRDVCLPVRIAISPSNRNRPDRVMANHSGEHIDDIVSVLANHASPAGRSIYIDRSHCRDVRTFSQPISGGGNGR